MRISVVPVLILTAGLMTGRAQSTTIAGASLDPYIPAVRTNVTIPKLFTDGTESAVGDPALKISVRRCVKQAFSP